MEKKFLKEHGLSGPMASGAIPRRPVVAVIDGQGGGLGASLVKELRHNFGDTLEIWALGANAIATAAMMKASANKGASGENPIKISLPHVKAVLGPIAMTWANSMMGEITPGIAEAITSAPIPKIMIPASQENFILAGYNSNETMLGLLTDAVRQLALIAYLSQSANP